MWNYRVLEVSKYNETMDMTYTTYAIHEVYYDDDGNIEGWTMDYMSLNNYESVDDMKGSMTLMMKAFEKPILREFIDEDGNEQLIEIN